MNLKVYSTRRGLYQGFLRSLFDEGIILSELVFRTSGKSDYSERVPENVVNYSSELYWTSEYSDSYDQYISIEIKNYFLDISAYAIGHNGYQHPVSWDFSVSSNGEDWVVLHSPRDSEELDSKNGVIFNVNRSFVRFFKWTNKGPNYGGNKCLYIRYVDLYGSVVKCTEEENCKNVPHIEKPTICFGERKNYYVFIITSFIFSNSFKKKS